MSEVIPNASLAIFADLGYASAVKPESSDFLGLKNWPTNGKHKAIIQRVEVINKAKFNWKEADGTKRNCECPAVRFHYQLVDDPDVISGLREHNREWGDDPVKIVPAAVFNTLPAKRQQEIKDYNYAGSLLANLTAATGEEVNMAGILPAIEKINAAAESVSPPTVEVLINIKEKDGYTNAKCKILKLVND